MKGKKTTVSCLLRHVFTGHKIVIHWNLTCTIIKNSKTEKNFVFEKFAEPELLEIGVDSEEKNKKFRPDEDKILTNGFLEESAESASAPAPASRHTNKNYSLQARERMDHD